MARATTIKPIEFRLVHQEHAPQHQGHCAIRMRLGIEQRKGRAPAAAKNDPFVDVQRMPNDFHVIDQMPCRVRRHTGMRARPATAALIEQYDAIDVGIKISPHRRATAATRTAMHNDNRQTVWIA